LVCCAICGIAGANGGVQVSVTDTNSVTGNGIGETIIDQSNLVNVNAPGYANVGVSGLNNIELKDTGKASIHSANTVNANVGSGILTVETLNNHNVQNAGIVGSNSQNTVNLHLGMGIANVKAWNLDTVTNAVKADITQKNFVNGYTVFGVTNYDELNQIVGQNILCEKGVQANINGIDPVGELNIKKVNMAFLEKVGYARNTQTNNIVVGIAGDKLTLDMSNYIQDKRVGFADNHQSNNAYAVNFAPTSTKITLTNEADGNYLGTMLNGQQNALTAVAKGSFSAELGNYGDVKYAGIVKFDQINTQNIIKH